MTPIVLQDLEHGSSAQILPELGFNCFSFEVNLGGRRIEILNSEPEFQLGTKKGTRSGIPLLFPFPNRIEKGNFAWNGKTYQLPQTDGRGNAIHGFVMDRPWRVTEVETQSVKAEFQLSREAPDKLNLWPEDFLIEVQYRLRGNALRTEIRIVNPGKTPLPWGFGTHPYFNLPLSRNGHVNQCQIQVPASQAWKLQDFIPTGEKTAVDSRSDLQARTNLEGRALDDVLTTLTVVDGHTEASMIDHQMGIQVTQVAHEVFRECVVFTPPGRDCVCLEPYTCTTNAINLQQRGVDAGLKVLAPGEEFRTWIEIQAEPIRS